ncbi:MAG: polysaccharide pyruvyl transferase family protein [Bifidobacterium sp.]|nr:polysaccharide pyruvyl transferase family protein [Bifidobacterium sp.]
MHDCHPRASVVDTTAQIASIARGDIEAAIQLERPGRPDAPRAATRAIVDRLVEALDDEGSAARYAAGLRLLTRHTRDVHVIGGGYMNSDWNANLARLAVPRWAAAHGLPSAVTGVGLEPLTDGDAAFAREVADTIDAFSCRDTASRDAVGGRATLAPDDCFVNGLDGVYLDAAAALPDVMVCTQSDLVGDKRALLDTVLAVLARWNVAPGARIGVVECIPYDSQDTFEMLRAHGYAAELYPLQNMLDDGFPARAGQTWLSTRYHPHLLAAAIGARGSYIPVRPGYYDIKHDAVLRMGSRWTRCDIGTADIPEPGPGFADPSVRYAYRDRIRQLAAPLYGAHPGE